MFFGEEGKLQNLLAMKRSEGMEVFNSYFWPTDFLMGSRQTLKQNSWSHCQCFLSGDTFAISGIFIEEWRLPLLPKHFGCDGLCLCMRHAVAVHLIYYCLQNRCICSWIKVAEAVRKVLSFLSDLDVGALSVSTAVELLHSLEGRKAEVSKIWLWFRRRTTGIFCGEGLW